MDVIFVEDPLAIQKAQSGIPASMREICKKQNIPLKGNAAGNYPDFLNLTGEVDIAPMECGCVLIFLRLQGHTYYVEMEC